MMDSPHSKYVELTDHDLLSRLKQGCKASYAEIYQRYKQVIYLHAYRMLEDTEAAKDVVQELFTSLWVKRQQLNIERRLSSYLYKAARNRVLDRIARMELESHYIDSLQSFAQLHTSVTDHRVRERELVALIEREISQLPRKMRVIFEMSRKDDLSHKQIAEELEISEKTVKKQINNALKVLRVRLGEVVFLLSFGDALL